MPIKQSLMGGIIHSKGLVETIEGKVSFSSWDFIHNCNGKECPLWRVCTYYGDGTNQRLRRCRVQMQYMANQLRVFLPLIQRAPDPFIVQAIGDHILPLYHDLCKVLMEITAYEGSLMYTDKGGKKAVMPLLKEKREIIGIIWKVMKESGMIDYAKRAGYFMPGGMGELPGIDRQKDGYGDGRYVDDMYKED